MSTIHSEKQEYNALHEAEQYVRRLLENGIPKETAAVKIEKTVRQLEAADTLIKEIGLSESDSTTLRAAVIFTYAGYSESLQKPFLRSAAIAEEYLKKNDFPADVIQNTLDCLRVKSGQKSPEKIIEEIYEDVQNSIFAVKKYVKKLLPHIQTENQINRHNPIKTRAWLKEHRNKLKSIDFNTEVAQSMFAKNLKRNAKAIKKLRKKKKKRIPAFNTPLDNSKGAQMMFKAALRNHIDLTSIADNKASIMLSINAIIITIAMPLLIRYMGNNTYLVIPMVILMITCVASIIFAALATRPIKTDGESDVDKVMERESSNLFFFGNFFSIPLPDYQRGIKKVIRSGEVLERSVINDLYFLGLALGKKFKLLRICYMVFMVGIALSVLSYGVVAYLTAF